MAGRQRLLSTLAGTEFAADRLPASTRLAGTGNVRVTFYGTSTLLFDDGTSQLLVDAFLTRPTIATVMRSMSTGEKLIGTDRAIVDAWLAREEVGAIRAIFAAHSHHDHAIDVAYVSNATGADVFGSESTLNVARGGGVPEDRLHRYRLGVEVAVGDFGVTVLPGKHPANPPPLSDDRDLTIDSPLSQPAAFADWVEGGSFTFLVRHGDRRALVHVPGYVIGALDDVRADVLFLSTVPIHHDDNRHDDTFYREIVTRTDPRLVVPIHWDNFLLPASADLPLLSPDVLDKLGYLKSRLLADGRRFGILQGFQTIDLFDS